MNDKQKAFQLYKDSYEIVMCLSDEQAGKLFKAIFELECCGSYLDTDDKLIKMAWVSISNYLIRDSEKYLDECEKRRINQLKRWAKEKNVSLDEYIKCKEKENNNHDSTSEYKCIQAYSDKDSDKEKDIEKDSDKDSEKEKEVPTPVKLYTTIQDNTNVYNSIHKAPTHTEELAERFRCLGVKLKEGEKG